MRIGELAAAILIFLFSFAVQEARSEELRVAVAANFLSTLGVLEAEFEATTKHEIAIIAGSTGLLYAQVRNGAPFDLLLAADQERPRLLAAEGFGDPSSVFTYATGRLALWSSHPGLVTRETLAQLANTDFRWLAIAEPQIAPYGIAARQTLEHLGFWQSLQSRIVRGQNIAQAFAMVDTGNAELGLVALSQVLAHADDSSYTIVPKQAHSPIRQDAIVLSRGMESEAAAAFVAFLKSRQAAAIIERSGYEPAAVEQ